MKRKPWFYFSIESSQNVSLPSSLPKYDQGIVILGSKEEIKDLCFRKHKFRKILGKDLG